jgi:glycosyltransferase involved in cell wall biosynthesis
MRTVVIIPALNEAGSITQLVQAVRAQEVAEVIVVDNGSTDGTAEAAERAGARVVSEPRRGYGFACSAGVAAVRESDLVVFIDGDYSFMPDEMTRLVVPIREGRADLVLGSRSLGHIAPGSMPLPQRFGNWLAALLIRLLYHLPITDLGPYRAIRWELLSSLIMREKTFGWPIEMIIKAARARARVVEVPVSYYSRRAGRSKVSGTVRGTILAGYHILTVTFRYFGNGREARGGSNPASLIRRLP